MFVVRHKATHLDGTAPAIQYGQWNLLTLCLGGGPDIGIVSERLWWFQYLY